MSDPTAEVQEQGKESGSWILSAILSLVILAAAGVLVAYIFSTEPTAKRGGATKKTAMLVDVVEVRKGDHRPDIVAQGTVRPARDIVLRPQVSGRITSVDEDFTPGGYVAEGQRLVRIESADFRNVLAQRESDLREAISALAVEKGRHEASKAEYDYLNEKDLEPENEDLLLRRPQLQAAEERVDAARAAVEQARLNVRRTTVEAPFDAHIVRRMVNVGSQVSPNDDLARLVGTDTYWVAVELPLSKLRWVTVDGENEGERGSKVKVRNRQAWPEGSYREGHLFKRVGMLDEDTRMAQVLAAIPDPLVLEGRDAEGGDEAESGEQRPKPELIIGEFLEVTIDGNEMKDVVRLDRNYVRADDTVWVMEEGKLRVKDVNIVTRDAKYAYIGDGLEDGAEVVKTNISTVVDGAALRLNGGGEESSDGASKEQDKQEEQEEQGDASE